MIRSQKEILLDLSADLNRVSYGYWIFLQEAKKRYSEVNKEDKEPYFQRILENLGKILENQPIDRTQEDALMYSTLIKNYALHRM